MEQFGRATGLTMKMEKSSVTLIRCSGINLQEVLLPFAGQVVSFPLTYLGLPLTLGKIRLAHLQPILDRGRAKMARWKGKLINIAGRRELVKSVLTSIPIYLLTALRVSKKFVRDLDRESKKFLWAGDNELSGSKCKVNWGKACMPQTHGGLGLNNLDYFSHALRLRWLWYAWKETQRPWVGMELPVDDLDVALFTAATKVQVNDGNRALFWLSSWL